MRWRGVCDDPKIYIMETLGVYFKVLKVNYNVNDIYYIEI